MKFWRGFVTAVVIMVILAALLCEIKIRDEVVYRGPLAQWAKDRAEERELR